MPQSLDYLHSGSAEQFIDALVEEVFQHKALHHPYLQRLAQGRLPNVEMALRDYSHQYSFYSNGFTTYLDHVISKLDSKEHRDALLENLVEEQGDPNAEELEKRPHVEIFADFKRQIGADDAFIQQNPPCTTALIWHELFLQKCASQVDGVGLGAIGLATEYIVPTIYPYFIKAIEEHTDLGERGSLFFRLHVECDEEHGDDVVEVTQAIAADVSKREAIRFGALSALNLRSAFWDAMLARALAMPAA